MREKIKSVQIQNLHNNGQLFEIGKKLNGFEIREIKQYHTDKHNCYTICGIAEKKLAYIDDCPVVVEFY